MSPPVTSASATSPSARQLSAWAEPPSGSSPSQDVRSQHATNQSPAAAAAEVSDATAQGDASEAASQEDRPPQLSFDSRTPPSHASGTSTVDTTIRPDPSPDDALAHAHAVQHGSVQQGEGMAQQAGPMPACSSDPNPHDEGHAPQLAVEALGSDMGEEDEGSGPEQDSDSAMQDEEEEEDRFGDLPSVDPGLGSESDFPHEPRNAPDVDTGEMELPEEGWMWSAVLTHASSS